MFKDDQQSENDLEFIPLPVFHGKDVISNGFIFDKVSDKSSVFHFHSLISPIILRND